MSDAYFSDREHGSRPRTNEQITIGAWGGIIALLQSLIRGNYFAAEFVWECPDGQGIAGTDIQAMALAIRAEIPEMEWPIAMDNLASQ